MRVTKKYFCVSGGLFLGGVGGFNYFFYMFIPNFGEDEPILTNSYFSDGLKLKPPASFG